LIHITDSQTDVILDDIQEELFWNDNHRKSLKDNLETFDFTTLADKRFSEHLAKRNRIIIPDEDGKYVEFIIENTRKFRNAQGGLSFEVYTSASYIELVKSKVIPAQTTPAWTPKQHVDFALAGTGWEAGEIHFAGALALTIEKHTNPFSYLKRLASEFNLELHFRVEKDGNKIVRRYVDLLERVGIWRGREVELGKDLIIIERKENMADIVTALVGLGPERQDGTRLEVFVEDKDALSRWGRDGQHLVEVYEPQSTDQDMTLERLTELTENELEKRINSVVEYQADIADLEKVPGLENEKIRFGDTIKIKDTAFNPPLYLEARVHTQERSIKKDGTKKVTLGDYIEHKEEDVLAIWRSLQSEIPRKVSMSDVTDVVYTKPEVDDKDTSVYQDSTYYSDSVSETKKQEAIIIAANDATSKANQAENNAKSHADNVASQAEQNAKSYAEKKVSRGGTPPSNPVLHDLWIDENDGYIKQWTGTEWKPLAPTTPGEMGAVSQTEYDQKVQDLENDISQAQQDLNQAKTDLEADIATKADATWVNGQLQTKADNSTVQDLQNEVADKADVTWVNNQLVTKETIITKSSTAPSNPAANQLWLDTSATPNVLKRWSGTSWVKSTPTSAGEVEAYTKSEVDNALNSKVSVTQYNTDVSGIVTDLQSYESRITQTENEIATKVSQTDYDALEGRVSSAETSIVQNANAIQSKVSQSEFDTLEGRVSTTESTITQHTNLIEQKVNQTDYITDKNGIVTQLDDHESRITQTESEITTKVSNTTYQQDKTALEGDISSLNTRMSQAETSITQNANSISLKANATDVYTKSQVDNSLANKADNSTVSAIEQRVTQTEAVLVVQADEISMKVSQKDFDSYTSTNDANISKLYNRMSSAETTIVQNSNAITLKANSSDVYTKSQVDSSLSTKADQSEVDNLETRISTAESTLTVQSNQIAAKVSQTDFDTFKNNTGGSNNFVTIEKTIPSTGWYRIAQNTGNRAFAKFIVRERSSGRHLTAIFNAGIHYGKNPTLTLTGFSNYGTQGVTKARIVYKSTYDPPYLEIYCVEGAVVQVWCVDNVQSTGWTKVDFTSGNVPSDYTSKEWDVTESKLVDVTSDNVALDTTKVNGIPASVVTSRLSTAESSITQLSNEIQLKVSQQEYDIDMGDLTARMTSAESSITLLSDEIDLRVEKNGIISAINVSPETIKLDASRIEFTGHVFGHDATFTGNLQGATGDFEGDLKAKSLQVLSEYGGSIRIDTAYWGSGGSVWTPTGQAVIENDFNNGTDPALRIAHDSVSSKLFSLNLEGKLTISNTGAGSGSREKATLTLQNYQPALDFADLSNGELGTAIRIENDSNHLKFNLINLTDFGITKELFRIGTDQVESQKMLVRGQSETIRVEAESDSWAYLRVAKGSKDIGYIGAPTTSNDNFYVYSYNDIIQFQKGSKVNTEGSATRWQATDTHYIYQDRSSGVIRFYMGGVVKHAFNADGTKTGGSIEIDGENLGMSPIDSPQVLLSTLFTNVTIQAGIETVVLLDDKFAKAVSEYAVFPSHNVNIRKEKDKFFVLSDVDCVCDFVLFGKRIGYEHTYWMDIGA